MSRAVARVGDRTYGTCTCHQNPVTGFGRIVTGSDKLALDDKPVARLGDIILADCGHEAVIVTASELFLLEDRGVARVGDLGEGCYNCEIIEGSETTITP